MKRGWDRYDGPGRGRHRTNTPHDCLSADERGAKRQPYARELGIQPREDGQRRIRDRDAKGCRRGAFAVVCPAARCPTVKKERGEMTDKLKEGKWTTN